MVTSVIVASTTPITHPGVKANPIYVGNPENDLAVLASKGCMSEAEGSTTVLWRFTKRAFIIFFVGLFAYVASQNLGSASPANGGASDRFSGFNANMMQGAHYVGIALMILGGLWFTMGVIADVTPIGDRAPSELLDLIDRGFIVEVHMETIIGLGDVADIGPNVTAAEIFAKYFAEIFAAQDLVRELDAPAGVNSAADVAALLAGLRSVGTKIRSREIWALQAERADAIDRAARRSMLVAELVERQP